jgi:hypothetical protein
MIDGEILLADNPISITCLSRALTVFTPLPIA